MFPLICRPTARIQTNKLHLMSLHSTRPRWLILACFLAVYGIWGSTYLAIRMSIETLPPFLMAGLRFFLAGVLLYAWLRATGSPAPTGRQWRTAAVQGFLLLTAGNSVIVWAEQWVPSSLAALIVCTQPVWFALTDWLRPGGKAPRAMTWAGIAVGLLGVLWLIAAATGVGTGTGRDIPLLLAVLAACVCWSAGSVLGRQWEKPASALTEAAMQMICGGTASLIVAAIRQEGAQFHWSAVSHRSLLAFGYLVVFGSWIAYSAYVYLLQVCSPSRVSTYAYVNPIIAVLLGALLAGERVTPAMGAAGALTICGVVLLTCAPRSRNGP